MSRRLGLVIGVNQYQDTAFHSLQYAENDARALAQWLVNVKGGNWSPPDVQLIQGQHATKELIESQLSQMCLSLAAPDDLIFIYFAGHAFIDERTGDGYLAFANTSYQDATTALPLASFVRYVMARCRAAHLVLLLDCYQTGNYWMMRRSSPYDFRPLLATSMNTLTQLPGNRLLLCSCRGNSQAPETGERGLGLFLYRTILGLCGPAIDTATNTTSLEQLYSFLTGTLPAQQQPQLFGQTHSPLLLVGDLPASPALSGSSSPQPTPSQTVAPMPTATTSSSTGEQPFSRGTFSATATIQPPPSPPHTPQGALFPSEGDIQRRQQSTYMIEQAQQYLQRQQPQEALQGVEQALQLDPTNIAALILKAQVLGTLGRLQEALTVTDQLGQLDANNALVWSIRAVILTNMGQYQPALAAIEHALELDMQNPETHAIKNTIMEHMAIAQSQTTQPKKDASTIKKEQRGGPLSFFKSMIVQILALGMGIVGTVLPILLQQLPMALSFVLESLGLALLCVVAVRGAFRYGFLRFLFTLLLCIVPALILGGLYKLGYTSILAAVAHHTNLLLPFVFLAGWLALAAVLPLILALAALIVGLILRVRRK